MNEKKRILLVEDEPDLIKLTVFRLEKAEYEVIVAADGKQGLEIAEKERPDLILLDLGLPVIDGYEVCCRIKSDKRLKDIPVLIMTASTDRIKEKVKEIGADGYVLKPFEPQDLLLTIKRYVG